MSCEASGAAPRDCQAFMETLQSRIGYAAFLEVTAMGSAFERLAGNLPRPAPLLRPALRPLRLVRAARRRRAQGSPGAPSPRSGSVPNSCS